MRIVAALGGNALLQRGEIPDAEIEAHHVLRAARALAPVCAAHDVVITHGNGPQIGLLALESDADPVLSRAYPLDVLGAQTQGMIGYWLAQALGNLVPSKVFCALVCQTVVGAEDPAFAHPSKFVGQVYDEARATELTHERGWQFQPDGSSWRRVVASPAPRELVELPVIQHLLADGIQVICAGGGGVPVIKDEHGLLHGVEAVVDKDRTAAMLARAIDADVLLLLTDVEAVMTDFGTPAAREIRHTSVEVLSRYEFPEGSMGPKVEAACAFTRATRRRSMIGSLDDAEALLAGNKGTIIDAHRKE